MSAAHGPGNFVQIVLFETEDQSQQDLLLAGVAAQVGDWVRALPGFVSATFARSLDGRRVANVATWRSWHDWEAFTRDPRNEALGTAIHGARVRMGEGRGYTIATTITPDQEQKQ